MEKMFYGMYFFFLNSYVCSTFICKENFEDVKAVIRIRKWKKDGQYNG